MAICLQSSVVRRLLALLLGGALLLTLTAAHSADRDALRDIVQRQCLPDWLLHHDPSPCLRVSRARGAGSAGGYALLADRKGGAHFLLIPLGTLTGIESPELLAPDAPDYFAAAWQARDRVAAVVGHALPRELIGLAINSRPTRGQDQLHIHIECVGARLFAALHAQGSQLGDRWSSLRLSVWNYRAMRVMGPSLARDPVRLLADGVPGAREHMGAYTLVVVGMQFRDGPGFAIVTGRAVPGGELLLDGSCSLAHHLPGAP